MEKCSIVIGSLFGDEGKGHMTDILCSSHSSTLNVRFNGGAQASHTVVTPDGKRNAFRHFGSGTFAGAVTYLNEDFIVNIFSFSEERRKLVANFGITPLVYVNPNCIVTTFADILINQMVETLRGSKRHGSCGMGINETVERSKFPDYRITVMDLLNPAKLLEKAEKIQTQYIPRRLKVEYNLNIEDLPALYRNQLLERENLDMFLFYAQEFLENVQIMDNSVLYRFQNVVFEGAQGLLLDQNSRVCSPNYLTPSNTGITNVMKVLDSINYDGDASIYYMSRCYSTRHGAGPLPFEKKGKPYSKIVDETNITNEYQGALRFGLLDTDLLSGSINHDLLNLNRQAKVFVTLTCADQLDDFSHYVSKKEQKIIGTEHFLTSMSSILDKKMSKLDGVFATIGLGRDDIIEVSSK